MIPDVRTWKLASRKWLKSPKRLSCSMRHWHRLIWQRLTSKIWCSEPSWRTTLMRKATLTHRSSKRALQSMIFATLLVIATGFAFYKWLNRDRGQLNEDESEISESREAKVARYYRCGMSEVSDPDFWMEVRHFDALLWLSLFFVCFRIHFSNHRHAWWISGVPPGKL